ncbi:nodulation protein NfeD [Bacillus carboniphilus]|uniref:Nodulation protein NfeD n=1 Tax=Bacillus carboniphilus TaxID=86663 RepID=A0ABY9JXA0_9BACI|nr:nodulation protein NfeD [Bacillus carboniphilus]WLR43990.1 nodulation protein NfeD [Bacillus carboniphilus]
MKKTIHTLLLGVLFLFLGFVSLANANQPTVYVIPVEKTVERGLAAFIERSVTEAEEANSDLIIFEINTPGGAVDGALEIAKTINESSVETVAFINNQAGSAGAFIALNANEIYMVPNAKMGAAAVIDQEGNAADKKTVSYWNASMREAAELNNRDPIYAEAMADPEIDLPEYKAKEGKILTLTASEAEEVGYTEGIVDDIDQLLVEKGLEGANIVDAEVSVAEKIARFLTHPIVVPILISIGSLGLIVELYSPGFGVPGFMGLGSLLLFFYGSSVAGLAGQGAILLFIAGIILVISEFFVPGGILGTIGLGSIIISLFLASGNIKLMALSIIIALIVSVVGIYILTKVMGKRMNFFKKIILNDSTNTERGYISNKNRLELIGKEGISMTSLRPSGTAIIDEERLDVVTEGSYIDRDKSIRVVKVEGSRIVVREITEK